MRAFNNGNHPFTIAQVLVTRTGIVRIGPLQNATVPTKAPTPTPVTTTKAPALETTGKSPTRRPTKRPTNRVIERPTDDDEDESSEEDIFDQRVLELDPRLGWY